MRRYVLAGLLGITILAGCAYAATWRTIDLNADAVGACFEGGEKARVVIIYSNFEGDVEETRCYPEGGVN